MYTLIKSKPLSVGELYRKTFDSQAELNEKLEELKEHYRRGYGDGSVSECPEDCYMEIMLDHWPEPLIFSWSLNSEV